jgi:hypothetical protein
MLHFLVSCLRSGLRLLWNFNFSPILFKFIGKVVLLRFNSNEPDVFVLSLFVEMILKQNVGSLVCECLLMQLCNVLDLMLTSFLVEDLPVVDVGQLRSQLGLVHLLNVLQSIFAVADQE